MIDNQIKITRVITFSTSNHHNINSFAISKFILKTKKKTNMDAFKLFIIMWNNDMQFQKFKKKKKEKKQKKKVGEKECTIRNQS